MKLKAGDTVLVTAGKDKGKQGTIMRVFPKKNTVLVEGANIYTKHVKPYAGQSGDRVRRERALDVSKVAIINDKGERDRIGYAMTKDGKQRVFKKTGKPVPEVKKK